MDRGKLQDVVITDEFCFCRLETAVIPGHGGATTIARELASNPFLK